MLVFCVSFEAMVCSMGKEPDPSSRNRSRWVIPVEDPCKCTKIKLGGVNTGTPSRHFKVIYFDTFLRTPEEVQKWLSCSGKENIIDSL